MSEKEERGFDSLIISHLLRDRDLGDANDLPELTESERVAMNDVPGDLIERLWNSEGEETSDQVVGELPGPDLLNWRLGQLWGAATSPETVSPECFLRVAGAEDCDHTGRASRLSRSDCLAEPIFITVTEDSPTHSARRWPGAVGYFSQVGPFSYVVSAFLMCGAAVIAWLYQIPQQLEFAHNAHTMATTPLAAGGDPIGRITGEDACRWAEDYVLPTDVANSVGSRSKDACLLSGKRIRLNSGLLEVTYEMGAKVILEGPAVFVIDATGGFLHVGKLTGVLEKTADGSSPLSPDHRSFVIRTPTAEVADLGTEFGVEVGEDGGTTSHVFRGSVAVCSRSSADDAESVILREGESASARVGEGNTTILERVALDPARFVRRLMPGRVRILLFGTGHGLKGWQEDHRWDVVAVSSDPGFTPRPSVVIGSVQSGWARNLGGREMWVSLGGTCHQPIATGTICTFRTTFELEGRQPDTATIRGRVFAVGHATAVRLNGRSVPGFDGEKYVWEGGNVPRPLLIQSGFVAGTNVLEIDVASGKQLPSAIPLSTLGLRVELDGSVQPKP